MWVVRENGNIVRASAARQKDPIWDGAESLPDGHPDLVALFTPPAPSNADVAEKAILATPALLGIVRKLAKSEGKSEKDLIDEIKAEVTP